MIVSGSRKPNNLPGKKLIRPYSGHFPTRTRIRQRKSSSGDRTLQTTANVFAEKLKKEFSLAQIKIGPSPDPVKLIPFGQGYLILSLMDFERLTGSTMILKDEEVDQADLKELVDTPLEQLNEQTREETLMNVVMTQMMPSLSGTGSLPVEQIQSSVVPRVIYFHKAPNENEAKFLLAAFYLAWEKMTKEQQGQVSEIMTQFSYDLIPLEFHQQFQEEVKEALQNIFRKPLQFETGEITLDEKRGFFIHSKVGYPEEEILEDPEAINQAIKIELNALHAKYYCLGIEMGLPNFVFSMGSLADENEDLPGIHYRFFYAPSPFFNPLRDQWQRRFWSSPPGRRGNILP